MSDADGTLSLAASQLAPVAQDVPRPGDRVGRFLVRSRLGEGGMGVVLAGEDPDLRRPVAIKLLRAGGASAGYRARLIREAQALARLHHPNVVSVYEVGVDGERIFVAMELVTGATLTRWLAERRRPWREIVAMFLAVGEGVAAVHRAGLVHRDLKPDNVLVDETGRARVADFGLARLASDDGGAPADSSSGLGAKLTRTGAVMGTPGYMAPEQQWGAEVDARADQYSFCVAMRAALATVPLGAQETVDERGVARGGASGGSPKHDWSGVPRRLRDIVNRGLAYDASERYASMAELLAALRGVVASKRGKIAAVVVTSAFAVGVVGTSVGIAMSRGTVTEAPVAVTEPVVVATQTWDAAVAMRPVAPTPTPTQEIVAEVPAKAIGDGRGRRSGRGSGSGSGNGSSIGGGIGSGIGSGSGSGDRGGSGDGGGGGGGDGALVGVDAKALIASLPIKRESLGEWDNDNPEFPDGALRPASAFAGPYPDAATGHGPMTAERKAAMRSIAKQLGYHGLDTAAVDADPAGAEKNARDVLAALEAAEGESWNTFTAQVVLGLILRRRGDCDAAEKQLVAMIDRVRETMKPKIYDIYQLEPEQRRWWGRAHFAQALCWLVDKNPEKAVDQGGKWAAEARAIWSVDSANASERGEQQLVTAITALERSTSDEIVDAVILGWLEAAETHGGSKVKKLAAQWRKAAGL